MPCADERCGVCTTRDLRRPPAHERAGGHHQAVVACVRQTDGDRSRCRTVLRVTYEQVIREPVETLRAMHRHAGLELAPAREAFIRETIDPGRGRKSRTLSPDVLRHCVPILHDEMLRQGHDLPEEIRDVLDGRITDEEVVRACRSAGLLIAGSVLPPPPRGGNRAGPPIPEPTIATLPPRHRRRPRFQGQREIRRVSCQV